MTIEAKVESQSEIEITITATMTLGQWEKVLSRIGTELGSLSEWPARDFAWKIQDVIGKIKTSVLASEIKKPE